jgi:hypothetical protein
VKEVPPVEWARRLIDDQLERLSELRNANPRDPGFKLWRQTTLTVIQRIWPGDLARCERFRRIPFSSTSPRVTRGQMRDHFERGCAEASAYLRILTLELETQGLAKSAPGAPDPKPANLPADLAGPPPAAEAPSGAPAARDMYEPSPFDRIQPWQSPPAPASPVREERTAAADPPPPPAPEPTPAAEAPRPKPARPAPSKPPAEVAPPRTRRAARQQLKEMLGFGDEASRQDPSTAQRPGHERPAFAQPIPPPAFAAGPPEPENESDLEDLIAEAEDEALGRTPPEAPDESVAPEAGREAELEPAPEAEPEESPGNLAIEFLNRLRPKPSPRPSAPPRQPQPVSQAPAPAPMPAAAPMPAVQTAPAPAPRPVAPAVVATTTPALPAAPASPIATSGSAAHESIETWTCSTAAALFAIATQVERLGVPDGQRAAARAALVDLARQFEEEIASFDSIREILWVVADYPPLARRTIPLLVPYLDLE